MTIATCVGAEGPGAGLLAWARPCASLCSRRRCGLRSWSFRAAVLRLSFGRIWGWPLWFGVLWLENRSSFLVRVSCLWTFCLPCCPLRWVSLLTNSCSRPFCFSVKTSDIRSVSNCVFWPDNCQWSDKSWIADALATQKLTRHASTCILLDRIALSSFRTDSFAIS